MNDSINIEFSSRIAERKSDFFIDSNKPEANLNGDSMKAYREEKVRNIVEIPKEDSDVEYFLDDLAPLPGSRYVDFKFKRRKALGLDPNITMEETKYFVSDFERYRIMEFIKLNNIGYLLLDDSMFALDNVEQMSDFSGWARYFLRILGIIIINSILAGFPTLIWLIFARFDPDKQRIISYALKIHNNTLRNPKKYKKRNLKTNTKLVFPKTNSILFCCIIVVVVVIIGLIATFLSLMILAIIVLVILIIFPEFFSFPFLCLIFFFILKNQVPEKISIVHLWLSMFLIAASTFIFINLHLGHLAGNLHEVITPTEYLKRLIKQINIDESSFYLEFLGEIDRRFQTLEDNKILPKKDDDNISQTLKEMRKAAKTLYSSCDIYLGYLSIQNLTVINDFQVYKKLYPHIFSVVNCSIRFFRFFAFGTGIRLFRIFLPLFWIETSFSSYDSIILTVIILSALNFLFFKNNYLKNTAKSRMKKLNSLRRLSNMISINPILEDFMPKEFPSINIFCIFTIQSWSSLRKLVMCKNKLQDVIYDICYTFYYLYAFGIIIILTLDYYGAFWEAKSIMENTLLFSCMALDAIYLLVWMIENLVVNAQINEHYNIDKKTITDHITFLKKISINIEYIQDLKNEFNHPGGFLYSFAIKQIIRETKIYLNLNSEEEVKKNQIARYIDDLIKTLEGALSQLNIDNERNSEMFLGLISVSFTLFKSLLTALLPIMLSLVLTYIKNKKLP